MKFKRRIICATIFLSSLWGTVYLLSGLTHQDWQEFPLMLTGFIICIISFATAVFVP